MIRKLALPCFFVACIALGACAVSKVDTDLATAQNVCDVAVPGDLTVATSAASTNTTVAKVATDVNGACAAVTDAVNNESMVNSLISFVDNLFGVSATPATTTIPTTTTTTNPATTPATPTSAAAAPAN